MEYIVADILFFVVWLVLYIERKDLRKEMLVMSVLGTPLAFFDLLYVPTYWVPTTLFRFPIGIEGFIFSFLLGGIGAAVYAEIDRKKIVKVTRNSYSPFISLAVLFVVLPVALPLSWMYSLNIAIAMYIAMLVGVALTLLLRKDLLKSTLKGTLLFGTSYTLLLLIWANIFPDTQNWFSTVGLPRFFMAHVSLYEIVFGYIFGAYWGNLYELLFRYKFKNVK